MGFKFYKSVSVGKGLRMGVSKSGVGLSFGSKGYRYSVHSSGRRRTSIGIPGTGLSYQKYGSARSKSVGGATHPRTKTAQAPPPSTATLDSVLKAPLFASKSEKNYVRGVKAIIKEQFPDGLRALRECVMEDRTALSCYFLGAYGSIRIDRTDDAIGWLEPLLQADTSLPDHLMTKYRLDGSLIAISLPMNITPSVEVEIEMTTLGAALLLAELYQEKGNAEKAIGLLENLVDLSPSDPPLALSLAELYYQAGMWEELATLPFRSDNTDDLSAEVLRYRARALREKGLPDGAIELLKEALKSKKRHPEIIKACHYERALAYEALGKATQARKDFERVYAADPFFEDVAERLGLKEASSLPPKNGALEEAPTRPDI